MHAPQCLYAVRCKARTESLRHASCAWETPTDWRKRVVCKTRLHFDCTGSALYEIIRIQAVIPVHNGCRYPLNYSGCATFNSGAWQKAKLSHPSEFTPACCFKMLQQSCALLQIVSQALQCELVCRGKLVSPPRGCASAGLHASRASTTATRRAVCITLHFDLLCGPGRPS